MDKVQSEQEPRTISEVRQGKAERRERDDPNESAEVLYKHQPTINASQAIQVPPNAVEERRQAVAIKSNTEMKMQNTGASAWQGTPIMPQLLSCTNLHLMFLKILRP